MPWESSGAALASSKLRCRGEPTAAMHPPAGSIPGCPSRSAACVFPSLGISSSWMSRSLVHLGTLGLLIRQLWLVSLLSCCPTPGHGGPKGKGPVPCLWGARLAGEKGSMNSCNKGSWAWRDSFRAGDQTGATREHPCPSPLKKATSALRLAPKVSSPASPLAQETRY